VVEPNLSGGAACSKWILTAQGRIRIFSIVFSSY
jgi:hypothetical protein